MSVKSLQQHPQNNPQHQIQQSQRQPLVTHSSCPSSNQPKPIIKTSSPVKNVQSTKPFSVTPIHKVAFKQVLNDIPVAADTMRTTRAESNSSLPRTVFLLDWDDTCCATTYLEWYGIMADLDIRLDECAPQVDQALRVLEQRVLNLLKSAIQLGTVIIVTNAGDGWVELSSSRFLPSVRAFLDENYKSIKIISARARYIESYRQYPWRWKALTFSDILQTMLSERQYKPYELHVVVLGDSPGDRYAAYDASDSLSKMGMPVTLKIVKFLERPTIDQLCKELAVLLDHLSVMTRHGGAFEVSMSNEQQQQRQQHQQAQQQVRAPSEQPHHNSQAAPDGINAHDLSYHPYSSPSATTNNTVVESVVTGAEASSISVAAASLTSVVAPCAAAAV